MNDNRVAAAAEKSIASAAKRERLSAVKGMNDILPSDSARWEWFEAHVRDVMGIYAYRNIRTPIVEQTALFVKGTGESTDIVEHEMYSFVDRLNGEQLTLRPENTPGVVRAAIELTKDWHPLDQRRQSLEIQRLLKTAAGIITAAIPAIVVAAFYIQILPGAACGSFLRAADTRATSSILRTPLRGRLARAPLPLVPPPPRHDE